MEEEEEDDDVSIIYKKPEELPVRKFHKIRIPRRAPSVVEPPRQIKYITPDKTTCFSCPCYPKEDPYDKKKKLTPCQKSPLTLYEYASVLVNSLKFPEAFEWSEEQVADWMETEVGLWDYRECIMDNHINGRRLLLLEDPSHMPMINLRNYDHIKMICKKIHELYSTEFIKFTRSIGLPPRKPLTHCTFFKSRTGPSWGIRENWDRCDILRWMKILMPAPVYRDHWDMVWYRKPEFPKVKFARVPKPPSQVHIPHYDPSKEICYEYVAPRKFRLDQNIAPDEQNIWLEHRPESATRLPVTYKSMEEDFAPKKKGRKKRSRLEPKKICLKGLAGEELILARRLMPKKKFII